MREALREARRLPLILRCTIGGSLVLSAVGGAVGLLFGLDYLPTVWFAVLEGGFIGGVAGAALGLLVGTAAFLLAATARRFKHLG